MDIWNPGLHRWQRAMAMAQMAIECEHEFLAGMVRRESRRRGSQCFMKHLPESQFIRVLLEPKNLRGFLSLGDAQIKPFLKKPFRFAMPTINASVFATTPCRGLSLSH